jgi:hypothetical protein
MGRTVPLIRLRRAERDEKARAVFRNKSSLLGVNIDDQEGKRGLVVGAGEWYPMGVMDTARTVGMALERALPALRLRLTHIVEGADVAVVEGACQARFLKHLRPGTLVPPVQYLEGHATVEPDVARQVHGAVLAVAELMLDHVVPDCLGLHRAHS